MFLVGKGLIVSGLIWQSNLRSIFVFWTCLFCLSFLSIFLSILPLKRCAGKKPNPLFYHMKTRLFKTITSAFFHYLATAASAAGQKQKAWRITFPIDFHAAQYFWRWGRGCRFPRFLPTPFPHAKRRQGPFVILRLFGHASCLAWLLKIPAAPCRCVCPE